MINLPPEHELMTLFEAEPKLADPEYPWQYNTVTFDIARGDDQLNVVIDAGLERVRVTWSRSQYELLDVVLEGVASIAAEVERGTETFVATFPAPSRIDAFRLRLKPDVHVYWRTIGNIM